MTLALIRIGQQEGKHLWKEEMRNSMLNTESQRCSFSLPLFALLLSCPCCGAPSLPFHILFPFYNPVYKVLLLMGDTNCDPNHCHPLGLLPPLKLPYSHHLCLPLSSGTRTWIPFVEPHLHHSRHLPPCEPGQAN